MRYVYSVIRFVPDPVSAERVNVGVIVGSDASGEWSVRQVENLARASRIDERLSLSAVRSFVDGLERRLDDLEDAVEAGVASGDQSLSEGWLLDLHERMRNVVQLSRPAPLLAENVEGALQLVWQQHVIDPVKATLPYQRRSSAIKSLRSAYLAAQLKKGEALFEGVTLQAGPHHQQLDFAVANGHVVQVSHGWSFQLPDEGELIKRVRSWGWALSELRSGGGRVRLGDGRTESVARDIDVAVVYVPPSQDPGSQAAFEDARGVFERLHVSAVSVADATSVASRAVAELVAG